MTSFHFGFSLRSPLLLLTLLLTFPTASFAQQNAAFGGSNCTTPPAPGVIATDDFDDQACSQNLWGLDSLHSWADHFIGDGSGGYALNFFDEDDGGTGQDSNPDAGTTLPPPIQSGGGGLEPVYYAEGYFSFDMALYAHPDLARSPRMTIFALNGPDLSVQVLYDSGYWFLRLMQGSAHLTAWQPLPAYTTACHLDIEFVAGNAGQTGHFRVDIQAFVPGSPTWNHTAEATFPMFTQWHSLFLGMQTPSYETFVPPISSESRISWLTAIAYDNFFAYSEEPASWPGS